MPAEIPAVPQRDPEERIAELLAANAREVERRRWAQAHERVMRAVVRRDDERFGRLFVTLARHDDGEIDAAAAVARFRAILEGDGS